MLPTIAPYPRDLGAASLAPTLDWRLKGLPARAEGRTADSIHELGLRLLRGELMMPAAVLRSSALEHNRQWMRKFLAASGLKLCPHGKTTMSPEIFRLQAEDGVWGMTAATAHHVRIYRHFGIRRILLANQLVGAADIAWVLDEMTADPEFDFYCLVDSPELVEILAKAVESRRPGRSLQVLIELGAPGGRTGTRSARLGLEVARAVATHAPSLELAGVECFEGIFSKDPDALDRIDAMLDEFLALAEGCHSERLFRGPRVLISAGGSAFIDLCFAKFHRLSFAHQADLVLRSGCYITHDSGMYETFFTAMQQRHPELSDLGEGPKPALEVWACIQSTPEAGRAVATLGRRDASYDDEFPRPLWWFREGLHARPQPVPPGYRVTGLFDQHAIIDGVPGMFAVGDLVGFGISHPCTTFDKWRALYVVDDEYQVQSVIGTYF